MSMDVSRLQVAMEEGERWTRRLSVTVPVDLVQAERQTAVRKLASQIRLPGYRAGKIPAAVIEKRFGAALNQELLDRVVGEAYRAVLDDRGLRPITEGEVSQVKYDGESDLAFEVKFEVAPSLTLDRTSGFTATRPALAIGDEEVGKVLEQVQKQHVTLIPTDSGKPVVGNWVKVRIQRLEEDGEEPRPYEFILGEGEAIPDVEASIQTLDVGGDGEFTVTFPEDFPNEERRGQSDRLRIWLEARKERELPALDDAFAAMVGPFESIDALKDRIRDDLTREAEEEAENAVRGQLLEQLIEANPFDVPQSMIDQYIRSLVGGKKELTREQVQEARVQLGARAEVAVKQMLILEAYADANGLRATEEDVDLHIEEVATKAGQNPGEVYARLQKAGRIERLEAELTEKKVFDRLKADSSLTEAV
jgi:trigger factor